MGMNYYVVENKPSIREPIHIGKSSIGWLFLFQSQNDEWTYDVRVVWNTYNQVKEWLEKYTTGANAPFVIMNEENQIVSYDYLIDLIEIKQKDEHCLSNPENFTYSKNVDGYRFSDSDFS